MRHSTPAMAREGRSERLGAQSTRASSRRPKTRSCSSSDIEAEGVAVGDALTVGATVGAAKGVGLADGDGASALPVAVGTACRSGVGTGDDPDDVDGAVDAVPAQPRAIMPLMTVAAIPDVETFTDWRRTGLGLVAGEGGPPSTPSRVACRGWRVGTDHSTDVKATEPVPEALTGPALLGVRIQDPGDLRAGKAPRVDLSCLRAEQHQPTIVKAMQRGRRQ